MGPMILLVELAQRMRRRFVVYSVDVHINKRREKLERENAQRTLHGAAQGRLGVARQLVGLVDDHNW